MTLSVQSEDEISRTRASLQPRRRNTLKHKLARCRIAAAHLRGPRFKIQSKPGRFFIGPLCPPDIRWVTGLYYLRESKGGEESNGMLPQNAKIKQDTTPASPRWAEA
ncbi:hypothetical protein PoB_006354600 [Plakobranchus ocellatus]|uniref:Uncharacterized protein n=1 Tax=Plakobranchus ocellatus TaxID=259542 RepID=A0AAV4CYZ9_9GAST|nr:hypothetical protein PoB_006354600 [Plakobranchus ocellatus]